MIYCMNYTLGRVQVVLLKPAMGEGGVVFPLWAVSPIVGVSKY